MSPSERQQKLLEILCFRRYDTIANLARELNVSRRTICRDLVVLMCSYPIETVRGRYGGGVKIADGFYLNWRSSERKELSSAQIAVLKKARFFFQGRELAILNSIILLFPD